MKFITVSDTHGKHSLLNLPPGDAIIHAGDVSKLGRKEEVIDFLNWFSGLPYQYKIFIAGNHDFFFEKSSPQEIFSLIPSNVIYLNDNETEIEGLKIWGSPVTPWFHNWAFNRERGADIRVHWDQVPGHTDILITHGPPFRRLDLTSSGQHVGCKDLYHTIEKVKPRYHLFGHIHEAYGLVQHGETTFINASFVDVFYDPVNNPITFEI